MSEVSEQEFQRERLIAEAWERACIERDAALARVDELEAALRSIASEHSGNRGMRPGRRKAADELCDIALAALAAAEKKEA